jgi:hypothetical protein
MNLLIAILACDVLNTISHFKLILIMEMNISEDNSTLTADCLLRFDRFDFKVQAALRSVIGLFSAVCCALVIFIIVLFKKYKFYTQRLILYLAIAAMIHAFSFCLTRVNYTSPRPIEDNYCNFGALLNHYTAANEVLSVCFMTLNLVVKAVCNRSTVKAEPFIVLAIFLLPATWCWVPYVLEGGYGTTKGWCTIRTLNEDCTPYRYEAWLQFGLRYIPLYTLMLITIISIVLVGFRMNMASMKWDTVNSAIRENLKREILSIILYPIIFILFNIFSLINQIYTTIHPDLKEVPPAYVVLIYLRVLTTPLRGAFIALAFALDKETRKRLRLTHCRAACLEWVRGRETVKDFKLENSKFMESYNTTPYHEFTESTTM